MKLLMGNPIYTGMGPYPAPVNDETWVRAATQMIKKVGSERFLVPMLYVLRQSLGTDVSGPEDREGD